MGINGKSGQMKPCREFLGEKMMQVVAVWQKYVNLVP